MKKNILILLLCMTSLQAQDTPDQDQIATAATSTTATGDQATDTPTSPALAAPTGETQIGFIPDVPAQPPATPPALVTPAQPAPIPVTTGMPTEAEEPEAPITKETTQANENEHLLDVEEEDFVII
jgi:hypothetical protein